MIELELEWHPAWDPGWSIEKRERGAQALVRQLTEGRLYLGHLPVRGVIADTARIKGVHPNFTASEIVTIRLSI